MAYLILTEILYVKLKAVQTRTVSLKEYEMMWGQMIVGLK